MVQEVNRKVSLRRSTTRDTDGLTVNPVGIRTGQEADNTSDIDWLSDTAERSDGSETSLHLVDT